MPPKGNREDAIEYLKTESCSCVICNNGNLYPYFGRGVADLLNVLEKEPEIMAGAFIADKVVGKAAAALMITGKAKEIYAVTVSEPALDLLNRFNVKIVYEVLTGHIINRTGTDWCPLERLCSGASDVADCVSLIKGFVNSNKRT